MCCKKVPAGRAFITWVLLTLQNLIFTLTYTVLEAELEGFKLVVLQSAYQEAFMHGSLLGRLRHICILNSTTFL